VLVYRHGGGLHSIITSSPVIYTHPLLCGVMQRVSSFGLLYHYLYRSYFAGSFAILRMIAIVATMCTTRSIYLR